MTATHQLTATQLAQAIRNRQIRAVEAVAACFEQIDRHNDRLKAMITLCRERAEAEAIAADAAIDRGESVGALHGVPLAVKDLTLTVEVCTTFGSKIYQDYIPQQDELCVARLRAAGGILIGKTNTLEFGMGAHCTNALYGPTANPYDPDRSSGGSSGGAAVSVCTGMGYLAQGTDMGGSCRTPASFCGVIGLRPSAGRIPRRRKPLLWDFLDTDGILARTVEDAALMLSVMAGADDRDPLSIGSSTWRMPDFSITLSAPVRLAFSASLGIATIDSEVEAVFQQAIAQMAAHCSVKAAHPDCSMATFAFETLRAATLLHKQKHHYEKYHHLLSASVRWIVIPCGWTVSGLPIGMQLVGKPNGEAALFQFAYVLQEALNFRHRWI
jgi:amidase